MKKLFGVFVLSLLILSSWISFVSASPLGDAAQNIKDLLEEGYNVIKGPLGLLIGETAGGDTFLAKLLFLFIIFSLVWVVLDKINFFETHDWALWLVSISVSVLSIRWITESSVIEGILLPYSTLGVTVTAGLPFVLFFLFIKDTRPKLVQKIAWAAFAVVFVLLYIYRFNEIGAAAYAYIAIFVISLAMVFGGVDWTDRIERRIRAGNREELTEIKVRNQLRKEAEELRQARGHLPKGEYDTWKRALNSEARRSGIDPKTL